MGGPPRGDRGTRALRRLPLLAHRGRRRAFLRAQRRAALRRPGEVPRLSRRRARRHRAGARRGGVARERSAQVGDVRNRARLRHHHGPRGTGRGVQPGGGAHFRLPACRGARKGTRRAHHPAAAARATPRGLGALSEGRPGSGARHTHRNASAARGRQRISGRADGHPHRVAGRAAFHRVSAGHHRAPARGAGAARVRRALRARHARFERRLVGMGCAQGRILLLAPTSGAAWLSVRHHVLRPGGLPAARAVPPRGPAALAASAGATLRARWCLPGDGFARERRRRDALGPCQRALLPRPRRNSAALDRVSDRRHRGEARRGRAAQQRGSLRVGHGGGRRRPYRLEPADRRALHLAPPAADLRLCGGHHVPRPRGVGA